MKFRLLIAAIVFSLALPAAAQLRTIAESYELTLSYLRLPQSEAGLLGFKRCATCALKRKRVGTDTEWLLNGRRMSLTDFRLAVARLPNHDAVDATVRHHLENDRITKVSISYP